MSCVQSDCACSETSRQLYLGQWLLNRMIWHPVMSRYVFNDQPFNIAWQNEHLFHHLNKYMGWDYEMSQVSNLRALSQIWVFFWNLKQSDVKLKLRFTRGPKQSLRVNFFSRIWLNRKLLKLSNALEIFDCLFYCFKDFLKAYLWKVSMMHCMYLGSVLALS